MSTKKIEMSNEVKAIIEAFKSNPGKKMSFAEVCKIAGVDAKTGYLTGVKKALKLDIGEKDIEIETTVTKKVNSYTYNDADAE